MRTQTTVLSISSAEIDANRLQQVTRDICQMINKETEMNADIAESPSVTGSKGDAITVGTLILSFVTGGGAVALINVLKTYIDRGSQLAIKLERDGKVLTITSKNIAVEQIEHTMEKAKEFFA